MFNKYFSQIGNHEEEKFRKLETVIRKSFDSYENSWIPGIYGSNDEIVDRAVRRLAMKSRSRTEYSILNITAGVGGYIINTILGFICRMVL